jgi:hypothetical protein
VPYLLEAPPRASNGERIMPPQERDLPVQAHKQVPNHNNERSEFVTMATDQPTIPLGIEALSIVATGFREQADAYRAAADAKRAVAVNLTVAANICDRLASLRFEIGEILTHTTDPDTARELRDALDDAAKEV